MIGFPNMKDDLWQISSIMPKDNVHFLCRGFYIMIVLVIAYNLYWVAKCCCTL